MMAYTLPLWFIVFATFMIMAGFWLKVYQLWKEGKL